MPRKTRSGSSMYSRSIRCSPLRGRMASALVASAAIATLHPMTVTTAHAADQSQQVRSAPIESVILSSGGLASVSRHAELPLLPPRPSEEGSPATRPVLVDIPLEQVNDVLKSLIVRGDTAISSVQLDGMVPLAESFARLPFTADELASLEKLADALRGTMVRLILASGEPVEGAIMGVDRRPDRDPEGIGRESFSLLSLLMDDGGLRTIPIGPDTKLEILDEKVREDLRDAMEMVVRARNDQSRTLEILVDRDARSIGLSYLIPAPVWKTTYRLILNGSGKSGSEEDPDASSRDARLQAWAVVENATGEDWNNIKLVLTTGNPVAVRQDLHERVWSQRPEIPVFSGLAALPPIDGLSARAAVGGQEGAERGNAAGDAVQAPARRAFSSFDPLSQAMEANADDMAVRGAMSGFTSHGASDRITGDHDAIAAESGTMASWQIPYPVTIKAGRTMTMPFIDGEIAAERVSVWRGGSSGRADIHPMASVMISNRSGTSLPPGVMTVYDTAQGMLDDPEAGRVSDDGGFGSFHVGDAVLAGIPAGEERLAGFAADRKVEIVASERHDEDFGIVAIADGIVRTSRTWRRIVEYDVKGAADGPRTILIEHPVREGWEIESEALDSSTATHHRLRLSLDEGESRTVSAIETRTERHGMSLVNADSATIGLWVDRLPEGNDRLARALEAIAELRRQAGEVLREIEILQREVHDIASEQERVRANLGVAPQGSPLAGRYLSMLETGEDRLEKLKSDIADKRSAANGLEREIARRVTGIRL